MFLVLFTPLGICIPISFSLNFGPSFLIFGKGHGNI